MSLIPSGFAKSASAGFYDHPIEQSLRLNDDDSAYLSWTPASAGNRKTFTFSVWFKVTVTPTERVFLAADDGTASNNNFDYIYLNSNGKIAIYGYEGGQKEWLETTQVLRDPSAWYHLVVAFDTTQSTASDRIKIYLNGNQITSFSTSDYPSQNLETRFGNSNPHIIGKYPDQSTSYLDGYLSEVHFIDGTALDASSFGETKSGVWIPKAYSGSYGTNGFYLDFGNSGSIGADVSGNGNNWTANNLAATDVVLDSPTNNFATLNPLDPASASSGSISEGNLLGNNDSYQLRKATWYFGEQGTKGKWYWEVCMTGSTYPCYPGITSDFTQDAGEIASQSGKFWFSGSSVKTFTATSYTGTGNSTASGDVLGFAYDVDNGTMQYYFNGSLEGTDSSIGTSVTTTPFFFSTNGPGSVWRAPAFNFGQDSSFAGNKTAQGNTDANGYGDFYYAPPTGYLALCTANLTVPDAMNPALDNSPQDYFNTVLWTGNSTARSITGVGFQPDFTWIKARNYAVHHALTDAVRGAGTSAYNSNSLNSNQTAAEDYISAGYLSSFDTDGFSLDTDVYWDNVNMSGKTYVAWNWKANGSGVSNTDGSITSTVSANTDAGFSIVSYTGTGSAATVGHGLGVKPEMVILKNRSGAYDWPTWHQNLPNPTTQHFWLNATNAAQTVGSFNSTQPTSSVFSIGTTSEANNSGHNFIAYCFHSVEGFSKFGSYTGNGSTDGPMIYCGFKPSFVMFKRTDNVSGWSIYDSERTPFNQMNYELSAHLSDAEFDVTTTRPIDFLSNGFKIRGTNGGANASGGTYIFMAFSSNPFKFSTAR